MDTPTRTISSYTGKRKLYFIFAGQNEKKPELFIEAFQERCIAGADAFLKGLAWFLRNVQTQEQARRALIQFLRENLVVVAGTTRNIDGQLVDYGNLESTAKTTVLNLISDNLDVLDDLIKGYNKGYLSPEVTAALRQCLSRNTLEQVVRTETELRHAMAGQESDVARSARLLSHQSETTEANFAILFELIAANPGLEGLKLISSPEHMYRIEMLLGVLLNKMAFGDLRILGDTLLTDDETGLKHPYNLDHTVALRTIGRLASGQLKVTTQTEPAKLEGELRTRWQKLRALPTELLSDPLLALDYLTGTDVYPLLDSAVKFLRSRIRADNAPTDKLA